MKISFIAFTSKTIFSLIIKSHKIYELKFLPLYSIEYSFSLSKGILFSLNSISKASL